MISYDHIRAFMGRFPVDRRTLISAVVLFSLGIALNTLVNFSPFNLAMLLTCPTVPAVFPLVVLSPLIIARMGSILISRDLHTGWYDSLLATNLSTAEIVLGYVLAAIFTSRKLLRIMLILMPFFGSQIFFTWDVVTGLTDNQEVGCAASPSGSFGCDDLDYHQFVLYQISLFTIDGTEITVGLLGIIFLTTTLVVTLELRQGDTSFAIYAVYGLSALLTAGLTAIGIPELLFYPGYPTSPHYVIDPAVIPLIAVAVTGIPYPLAIGIIAFWAPDKRLNYITR